MLRVNLPLTFTLISSTLTVKSSYLYETHVRVTLPFEALPEVWVGKVVV